jgi:hypothetical protein
VIFPLPNNRLLPLQAATLLPPVFQPLQPSHLTQNKIARRQRPTFGEKKSPGLPVHWAICHQKANGSMTDGSMTQNMKKTIFTLLALALTWNAFTQILEVPTAFPTIQAAINAAADGDTVLVQPGEYFENLRFKGKSIVLTSRFYQTGSAADIANTIINGSQPSHPDTASCILLIDGEDASTVVQGFTITGGKGTKWLDAHGAGTYREGGAILSEGTSPTIQFNIITGNVINVTGPGVTSTGGGGIRCDGGSPVIRNNWIHHNTATGYGGGMVLNYCTGKIHNNVVSYNEGGVNFGGGGLWLNGANQNTVVEVYNNTVVYNKCTGSGQFGGKGGGLFVFSIKADTRNNIFWGNTQTNGGVFSQQNGGLIVATHSNIQGNVAGHGNLHLEPLFADSTAFTLRSSSPCKDAGDPAVNDLTVNGLDAEFPGLCGARSDMGAFGGAGANALPFGLLAGANLFRKITTGPHTTTLSDSRSVSFVDVNDDGLDDLFITNGPEAGAKNLLYLSQGGGRFSAVTTGDIVSNADAFDGATFADADNDGDLDAYAVTWYGHKNYLYFGNGDGTFTYLPNAAPSLVLTHSETTSWGDYDNDGLVDLYVTNSGGTKKNLLFHNDGGGAFTPGTAGAPVTDVHTSRSVNWTDFDNDNDLDLFVSNEGTQPDDLYRNDGGTFTPLAMGGSRSSMSSSWGDVDNDGDLDLFVANSLFFSQQNNQFFLNDGDGTFTEVTTGPLVTDGGSSYGSNFGDYDNDGDLDLVVANGFLNGQIVNFLYQNDGHGNFTRDLQSIENLNTPCSYGVAWGDADNDGFLDLGIATCKNSGTSPPPPNLFYLNDGNCHNWLKIKPEGTLSNRSAIGAKVWVTATIGGQTVTQLREISAQSGHCGQNSLTAHFGLGDAQSVTEVRVQFPSLQDTTLTGVALNQVLQISEPVPVGTIEPVDNEVFKLTVSPNPVSDTFLVAVELKHTTEKMQLRLTDAAGRVVFEKKASNLQGYFAEQISAKEQRLVAGSYFLTVEAEGVSKTVAVMLQ